jgi:Spy/CpxP family protein refolding chaperone
MRKFALVFAAASTLGLAAFAAAPAQAAATHLGITQAVPAMETMDSSVVQVRWHHRWESRGRWHRRWRSRR